MKFKTNKKFKKWTNVKEGDIICYYDKGKLHKQIVHSVENKTEVKICDYGNYKSEYVYKYIFIQAGKGSNIKIYDYDQDYPFLVTRYFTRFTSVDAALECISQYYEKAQKRADKIKKKYDRQIKIVNNYKNIIENYGRN